MMNVSIIQHSDDEEAFQNFLLAKYIQLTNTFRKHKGKPNLESTILGKITLQYEPFVLWERITRETEPHRIAEWKKEWGETRSESPRKKVPSEKGTKRTREEEFPPHQSPPKKQKPTLPPSIEYIQNAGMFSFFFFKKFQGGFTIITRQTPSYFAKMKDQLISSFSFTKNAGEFGNIPLAIHDFFLKSKKLC
jgi:hypothetical protein